MLRERAKHTCKILILRPKTNNNGRDFATNNLSLQKKYFYVFLLKKMQDINIAIIHYRYNRSYYISYISPNSDNAAYLYPIPSTVTVIVIGMQITSL